MWTILKGRGTAWINSHLIRPRGRACLSRMHTNAHKFVLFLLSRLLCVSTLRSAASSSVSFGFARKVVKKGSSSHRRVSFASTSQKIRAFPCRANPFVPPSLSSTKILLAGNAIFVQHSTLLPDHRHSNIVMEQERESVEDRRRNFTFGLIPEFSPVGRIFLNTGLERKCFLMEGHAGSPFKRKENWNN